MMNRLFCLCIIFSLIVSLPSIGQSKKSLKKGNKKYKKGEYELAIAIYEKALDKGGNTGASNFQIAESYRLSHRIKKAAPYYKAAIDQNYNDERATVFYAFALKANEAYKEAEDVLSNYLDVATVDSLRTLAENEYNNLRNLSEIKEKNSYYRVKNLEAINTKDAEYSPVYIPSELYFTSSRGGGKMYKATGTSFTDIYKVKTKGAKVDLNSVEMLNNLVNTPKVNDGCVTFSRDGRTMIFAKGNSGRKRGTSEVNLYSTRYRKGEWTEPKMLRISTPNTWDSTPALSRDGRTLYFASYNRKDGYGGVDIYQAKLDGRGRWGNVRNMGPSINTPGDEMFPYVANDGKLYFASTGHPGLGGLDIFAAERKDGKINIVNLGSPINSVDDDFGLNLYKQNLGFFSSNRAGGKGDDDIYTFVNDDPNLKVVNYFLAGTTVTEDEEGNETILANTKVQLIGSNGDLLEETTTSTAGTFQFRVYEGENYVLIGEKTDYFTTRGDFSMIGKSIPQEELVKMVTNKSFETKLKLDKLVVNKSIVLENILYDLNKWDIRDDAAIELDKLVNVLLDNPEIRIELSSHTDSISSDEYNLRLSQRRAQSAVDYIIAAGIDRERLVAKGYGESRPIARNTNPDGTDNPEGRQKNRRTEFKIISIDKVKKVNKDGADDGVLEEDDIDFDEEFDDGN
ncbi:OmpA family protein [Fulvivirgaceae bacterium BMA12]|uniref:OmpA family protein n=1 Tax=Agaribacillus aureus TaxID=3051825 RepID=A0ABT8L405_9BACT|nr:OmpA family protein [Fulvivirgaceae bacterium BMA12]